MGSILAGSSFALLELLLFTLATCSQVAYAVALLFTFPLQLVPAIRVIEEHVSDVYSKYAMVSCFWS